MDVTTFKIIFNRKRIISYLVFFLLLCIPAGFVYGRNYQGYRGHFREYTAATEELYVTKMEEYMPDAGIAKALIQISSGRADPFYYVNNGTIGANDLEERYGEYARYRIEYGRIHHLSPDEVNQVNQVLKEENVTLGLSISDIAWAPAEYALTNRLGMEDQYDPIQAGTIWALKINGAWKLITLAKSPEEVIGG